MQNVRIRRVQGGTVTSRQPAAGIRPPDGRPAATW